MKCLELALALAWDNCRRPNIYPEREEFRQVLSIHQAGRTRETEAVNETAEALAYRNHLIRNARAKTPVSLTKHPT
jgi:hypothetical protein